MKNSQLKKEIVKCYNKIRQVPVYYFRCKISQDIVKYFIKSQHETCNLNIIILDELCK